MLVRALPEGDYQVKAVNHHCGGAETTATHSITLPVVELIQPDTKMITPFVGIFIASETRDRFEPAWDTEVRDSTGVYGVKAGILLQHNDNISVFGQIGLIDRISINEGNIYPESDWFVDVGIDHKIGERGFIGAGLGIWNIDETEFKDTSLFVHGGSNIGSSNTQWFIEGRLFRDDLNEVNSNNMVSLGLRFLFPK